MLIPLLAAALWTAPPADTTPRWVQVSVGSDHACALDDGGRAYCWGSNHNGQLGAATPQKCGIVGESGHQSCYAAPSEDPLPVGGGMRFASILAGVYRTCALDREGRAFCWGADVRGGGGTCLNGARCSFAPQAYEPERRFRSLSGGARVICGVTVQNEALCTNLLNGDRWWELQPMRPVRPGTQARAVNALSDWPLHNVCMVDTGGAAWCRGSNLTAQLGAGDAAAVGGGDEVDSLVRVATPAELRQMVIMPGWMCALDTAGQTWCWGQRSSYSYHRPGEKAPGGCGATACATAPVRVARELRFREISGHLGRVCGLTAEGEAYCVAPTSAPASTTDAWADYVAAREQPDVYFLSLAGFAQVGEGSCGIRLDGALFCWGAANHPERRQIVHPAAAER